MPLVDIREIHSVLVCPRCRSALVQGEDCYLCTDTACAYSNDLYFPIIGNHPILVDFDQSILTKNGVIGTSGASPIARRDSPFWKRVRRVVFPRNPVAKTNMDLFLKEVRTISDSPLVLNVGGGTMQDEIRALYTDPSVQLIGFDIYATPLTQFIADGHQIPLDDQSVDGVWIQAVLEHVLDPWKVVSEIGRVLRKDGLVYSEVPFMQQVHSGPYDFTRFTDSGHRWLFRKFELINSGVVQGPGTQLLWTIDHVTRSVLRSIRAGVVAKALFFWLRYLDRVSPTDYAVDDACGVFFLGRKSERELGPEEMVNYYKGAQRTRVPEGISRF